MPAGLAPRPWAQILLLQKGGAALARRRRKQYLIGNPSRSQLGWGRRSVFVSQEKQAQHQAARRIKLWSRVVAVVVILGLAVIAGFFLWFYLVPYFHQELFPPAPSVSDPAASEAPLPVYDENGLPVYSDEVNLFTINQTSPSADYVPELTQVDNVQVDSRIADALRQLSAAAREDGYVLIFTDGYVSYEEQEKRYLATVEQLMEDGDLTAIMAKTKARSQTPMAGESDFQTGLCLRLAADRETFTQSKTYTWLKNNMGRFGFVFRYPEDKVDFTDLDTDLTVLRYVGSENAAAMQQRSMCLEEYINYLDVQ
jgi:D-alanyl-D-alanine carboxypeptidase